MGDNMNTELINYYLFYTEENEILLLEYVYSDRLELVLPSEKRVAYDNIEFKALVESFKGKRIFLQSAERVIDKYMSYNNQLVRRPYLQKKDYYSVFLNKEELEKLLEFFSKYECPIRVQSIDDLNLINQFDISDRVKSLIKKIK